VAKRCNAKCRIEALVEKWEIYEVSLNEDAFVTKVMLEREMDSAIDVQLRDAKRIFC
jgi:hypothetical protein